FDHSSVTRRPRFIGLVTGAQIQHGRMRLDAQNFDPAIFEQEIPASRITTTEFPRAIDLNHPITKVFGKVDQVPCRYINDDVVNSIFDYLVCRGTTYDVPTVWRVAPPGPP